MANSHTLGTACSSRRRRVDIEVPNPTVDRVSGVGLACYPWRSFYPLSKRALPCAAPGSLGSTPQAAAGGAPAPRSDAMRRPLAPAAPPEPRRRGTGRRRHPWSTCGSSSPASNGPLRRLPGIGARVARRSYADVTLLRYPWGGGRPSQTTDPPVSEPLGKRSRAPFARDCRRVRPGDRRVAPTGTSGASPTS